MSKKPAAPIVLDLAPLPREQIGPFLLLGVPKDADKDRIEANWAQRVIWARKSQIKTPLEDINWAREAINDAEKRIRADAGSFNLDTTDGALRRLCEHHADPRAVAQAEPLDVEKALADYTPPTAVPEVEEVRGAITVPDVPEEIPAVARVLDQFLKEPLDPWRLELPA
jgi:hypothetical protein